MKPIKSIMALVAGLALAAPAAAGVPVHQVAAALAGEGERPPSLAPVLKDVLPGVVNISVRGTVQRKAHPLLQDPEFRRYFGLPEDAELPKEESFQAVGSGVVLDPDAGYVITNAHVVEDADEIMITLDTGERYKSSLVGADSATDLAVIRVEPQGRERLQAIRWTEPEDVQVGDLVVAVGNPFGLNTSVAMGVVSGIGRSGLGIQGYEDFIQTDAAINPGHSGGPLVNFDGEIVGINVAILAPSGGNIGVGFALPAGVARSVAGQLIEDGEVRRGQIGIYVEDRGARTARAATGQPPQGAVVRQVVEDSPAAQAGLRPGDIITSANGEAIRSADDLGNIVALKQVGDPLRLELERDGEPLSRTLAVGEPLEEMANAPAGQSQLPAPLQPPPRG